MHVIGFYLADGFQMLDFAGPAAAFENARLQLGFPAYRMVVLSEHGGVVRNTLDISWETHSIATCPVDTLVVIGGVPGTPPSDAIVAQLVEASARCQRIASVCIGAFVLAAASLLDGKRATTHWRFAAQLQKEHPKVRVEADRIFCRDANLWTSAGITAGIDLSLALIEQDHGFHVAQSVAQELVVYHRRLGGQSQFAPLVETAPTNERITRALRYARDHIRQAFTIEDMAAASGMSLRQFSRAFRIEIGTTPARAVERMRVDLARGHIESGTANIENIAATVGFGDAERMRRAFLRVFGRPPQDLRRNAHSATAFSASA